MEELSIEQKAKRYDEAIEIARKLKNGEPINVPNGTVIPDVIFPELKEDEDDRIGKVIIEHFVDSHSCMFPYKGFTKEQIIDWLEKQGEKEPVEWSEKDENEYNHILKILNLVAEEQKTKGYNNLISSTNWLKSFKDRIQSKQSNKPQGKSALEAINEKTVDNSNKIVNSKFKVGDWVVRKDGRKFCNGYKFAQIQAIELDGEMYYLDTGSWLYPSELRLWSITDAKDGDILVSLSKMHPFIFNGHYDEDTDYVYAYCGISDIIKDNSFYFDKYPDEEFKVWDSAENVKPATRNQRNLLFSKMKDSGYEWDADNKELKLHSNV